MKLRPGGVGTDPDADGVGPALGDADPVRLVLERALRTRRGVRELRREASRNAHPQHGSRRSTTSPPPAGRVDLEPRVPDQVPGSAEAPGGATLSITLNSREDRDKATRGGPPVGRTSRPVGAPGVLLSASPRGALRRLSACQNPPPSPVPPGALHTPQPDDSEVAQIIHNVVTPHTDGGGCASEQVGRRRRRRPQSSNRWRNVRRRPGSEERSSGPVGGRHTRRPPPTPRRGILRRTELGASGKLSSQEQPRHRRRSGPAGAGNVGRQRVIRGDVLSLEALGEAAVGKQVETLDGRTPSRVRRTARTFVFHCPPRLRGLTQRPQPRGSRMTSCCSQDGSRSPRSQCGRDPGGAQTRGKRTSVSPARLSLHRALGAHASNAGLTPSDFGRYRPL